MAAIEDSSLVALGTLASQWLRHIEIGVDVWLHQMMLSILALKSMSDR